MNRYAMHSLTSVILRPLLLASLLLAGCGGQTAAPVEEPPLKGAAIGGPFTLTSEDGGRVSWSDFDGQYRIVYFGYAYCPDVCPTDTQRAMAGLKKFEVEHSQLGSEIQPIFISFDPARDTPKVLTEFTDNFHPRLVGLTGDEATLEEVAKAYGVVYSRGAEQPGGGYLMDHLSYIYLFDRNGEPLATLPTDLGPDAVAAELEKWVR